MRTTISEIAARAGVSTATVDRVLNQRPGVRNRTREIILRIAGELGYFGPPTLSHSSALRLDFVLPAGTNSFMRNLRNWLIEESTTRSDLSLRIHDVEEWNAGNVARRLSELRGQTDAVGVVAPDRPEVREELNALVQSGVKVATLVSDVASVDKVGYVGVDNRAAGRLAGLLMGRFLGEGVARDIVLFVGSRTYRGHEEREMGFRSILAEDFPELRIRAWAELGDDRDRAFDEMRRILAEGPVAGVYNIGSGNQGIARALRDAHLGRKTVFIGHDLTDATRLMLIDRTMDAVIDQNPRVEAREVVRLLVSAVRGTTESEYPPRLQVVFRENIPVS
ncbi:LacI family DNA-binding transcriptional regulator [Paracoccus aestuariivivens]|uniref:Substrate-binding domain-containing protein n=1 Tax=Paracoccus aestuariivivens TaxID=1820333 RepID=A0A6L6JCY3_9RHOB|nr:LacI family DNA-binding transcriptional regulator [Paracoccus aestuariivivens]MTH78517.1 substrate-binding domain-containing protein [Paracoccus aestuariivivens]